MFLNVFFVGCLKSVSHHYFNFMLTCNHPFWSGIYLDMDEIEPRVPMGDYRWLPDGKLTEEKFAPHVEVRCETLCSKRLFIL